jgi:glycosyltransferase involved in cell wall biosynthesis
MDDKFTRGIAICHYNRLKTLPEVIQAVKLTAPADARIVVCDDGSDPQFTNYGGTAPEDMLGSVSTIAQEDNVLLIQGQNLGVAANKNRALWALQDCDFICILEDDLKPTEIGWFEAYEKAAVLSGIHHFCRVQDKEVASVAPHFDEFMVKNRITPVYGPSPRGDLTFLTSKVVREVGAFNPRFRGVGYAHGEWSERVARAGLINHPNKWVDVVEARDKFEQIGDTTGGRWEESEADIKAQVSRNRAVLKELQRNEYTHHPLVLE